MKSSQLEWSTCQIPRVVFTRVYYRILLYYHGLCIAIYILSIDTMQSEFGDSIFKKAVSACLWRTGQEQCAQDWQWQEEFGWMDFPQIQCKSTKGAKKKKHNFN